MAVLAAAGALAEEELATAVATTATTRATAELKATLPSLRTSRDPYLQEALRGRLRTLGYWPAVNRGQLAVALVDVTHPERPRMAAVNAHSAMYAASLPKIAILLGAMQKSEDGLMALDAPTLNQLTAMIRTSSNSAASAMLDKVGYEYLADVLQSERYRLYDEELNGGLWVGKPYARSAAWRRDPLNNLSHAATVFQVARFYYLLDTGQLASPGSCEIMKTMLADPGIEHKFVRGLNQSRPGSTIYRKSGTWRTYHSDSALIERDGRRYIAVALANHPSAGTWLSRLIVAMDDLIYAPENVARDDMGDAAVTASSEDATPAI